MEPLEQVMDALDVETFFICSGEAEGRELMLSLLKSWGFRDVDIVFAEYRGAGAQVRGRAYVYRSDDDKDQWLLGQKE